MAGVPPPHQIIGSEDRRKPLSASLVDPRPKTVLVHVEARKSHLKYLFKIGIHFVAQKLLRQKKQNSWRNMNTSFTFKTAMPTASWRGPAGSAAYGEN